MTLSSRTGSISVEIIILFPGFSCDFDLFPLLKMQLECSSSWSWAARVDHRKVNDNMIQRAADAVVRIRAHVWPNTVVDSGTAGMYSVTGMSGLRETEAGSCQLLCQDGAISFQAFISLLLSHTLTLSHTHSLTHSLPHTHTRLTIISPTNFHLIFPLVHMHRWSSSASHPCTHVHLADTPCALSNPPLLLISGLGLWSSSYHRQQSPKSRRAGSQANPPLIALPSLICSRRKLVFFVFFFESIKEKQQRRARPQVQY